ncbi:MAG TPA: PVC-type heme-binding CxxCH protein, partial [Pirellulales bacterium]|nr:PVC-type heme-binding CxxCH protein [Pirellulales bacterium]
MIGVAFCLAMAVTSADAVALEMPLAVDPRLAIELFAADPDIVTPTGLAVDAEGRVLVVECHTHFPSADYPGLKADRLRMFVDTDGDGRADRTTTFFEGMTRTMNVGIHRDGSVYVATRNEIFRLRDTDGDGRADQRTPIAHLETEGDYPHNGLSGFAFDFEGNVYFGLGENKGKPFKLIGTDGSMASELEGGQVYRCRADGTKIEMLATGFWNPFHLAFDSLDRLFAVDNDPDSLPPCRLLHIVRGGNYGYRYRNGRKGVHPFTAWNGELPGTLPMVAGTGEAPSGIVAYESDHLPEDYRGELLVTSWGDHRIDRFHLEPRGASFQATPQAVVRGGENFRPVGIAIAPDGSLFVSDWVLKDYSVHGKGRIWHLRARQPETHRRSGDPREAIQSAHRPLREQAARQMAADKQQGRPFLADLAVHSSSQRVQAAAIAALASVGEFEPLRDIASGDSAAGIRALAIRCLPATSNFGDWIDSTDSEVRADALRRTTDSAHGEILWKNACSGDAFVAEAARIGLAGSGLVLWKGNYSARSPAERLAAVLVLRQINDPRAQAMLPGFLSDADTAVRFAAIQWVGEERLNDFRQPLVAALSAGPATARLFGGYLAALERLDGIARESS